MGKGKLARSTDQERREIEEQRAWYREEQRGIEAQRARCREEQREVEEEGARFREEQREVEEERARCREEQREVEEQRARWRGDLRELEEQRPRSAEEQRARCRVDQRQLEEQRARCRVDERQLEEQRVRFRGDQRQLDEQRARFPGEQRRLDEQRARLRGEQRELEKQRARCFEELRELEELRESRSWAAVVAACPGSANRLVARSAPSLKYESEVQVGLSQALLAAAPRIPVGTNFANEVARIRTTCAPYIGCPKSIHNLTGFLEKNPVVQLVQTPVLNILDTTAQGRLLFQTFIAVILDAYSNNQTWNGEFGSEDIRIINPRESKAMFMMILREPVQFDVRARPFHALANDLHKVGVILIPHFKIGDRLPAHFKELEELLERMKKASAVDKCDIELLSYHPAIMPSAGRCNLLNKLKRTVENRGSLNEHFVIVEKPTVYPDDWTKHVTESEVRCTILMDVYWHNNREHDPVYEYERNARGLIKFLRNVLEHGEYFCGLELYLAMTFSDFLPSILLDLLRSGAMNEPGAKEAWKAYKDSKSDE